MNIWKCKKCGNTATGTNKPLAGNCFRGGGHSWTKCAEPGSRPATYRCGKCGNTIVSQSKPLDRNCTQGGKCSWRKCQ